VCSDPSKMSASSGSVTLRPSVRAGLSPPALSSQYRVRSSFGPEKVTESAVKAHPSRQSANRRLHCLLPRNPRANPMPTALDVEDELVDECLMVVLTEFLGTLGEVVSRMDLEVLECVDEFRSVFTPSEAGVLNANLQEVHALVI